MRRARRAALALGAAAGAVGALAHFAGCGLPTEGTREPSAAGCDSAQECDDHNACTVETCSEQKICSVAPAAQPPDDHNDCTLDACNGGVESHTAKPDTDGSGKPRICKVGANSGTCVKGTCTIPCGPNDPPSACDDKNLCTTDACDVGALKCVNTPLDGAEPGVVQPKGDCQQRLCVGGQAMDHVADDTDLPDANQCQQGSCAAGKPSVTTLAGGTPCGPNDALKCDGAGNCGSCAVAEDCLPQDCKSAACTGGACQYASVSDGTSCDDGNACNGSETCAGGVCTGGAPPSCDDGVYCTTDWCDPATGCAHASMYLMACDDGDVCTDGESCQADETCGGGALLQCDDGVDCTADACVPMIGCVYTPLPEGASCGTGTTCAADQQTIMQCQSGACSPSTTSCESGCLDLTTCGSCSDKVKDGAESDVDCGGGSCAGCDAGKACGGDPDCATGMCKTGVCT